MFQDQEKHGLNVYDHHQTGGTTTIITPPPNMTPEASQAPAAATLSSMSFPSHGSTPLISSTSLLPPAVSMPALNVAQKQYEALLMQQQQQLQQQQQQQQLATTTPTDPAGLLTGNPMMQQSQTPVDLSVAQQNGLNVQYHVPQHVEPTTSAVSYPGSLQTNGVSSLPSITTHSLQGSTGTLTPSVVSHQKPLSFQQTTNTQIQPQPQSIVPTNSLQTPTGTLTPSVVLHQKPLLQQTTNTEIQQHPPSIVPNPTPQNRPSCVSKELIRRQIGLSIDSAQDLTLNTTFTLESNCLLHQACRLFPRTPTVIECAIKAEPHGASCPERAASPKRRKLNEAEYSYPINIALSHSASYEVLKLLVKAGPHALTVPDGPEGCASLALAIKMLSGNLKELKKVVELFLEFNKDCASVRDVKENYPLHIATCTNVSIVRILAAACPLALEAKNFHLQKPLDVAQKSGRMSCDDIVDFLQQMAFYELEKAAQHLLDDDDEI